MSRITASYSASETLPNGQVVHLRAIRPDDRQKLHEGFFKLSKASVRNRFFSVKHDLSPAELSYFTEVDFQHHVALVAELQNGSQRLPVGVGRFVSSDERPDHSEMAITVIDEMQGKGIGKVLLNHLIDSARELGIRHLDATVLAQNKRMSKMMRATGLPLESRLEDGVKTLCHNHDSP